MTQITLVSFLIFGVCYDILTPANAYNCTTCPIGSYNSDCSAVSAGKCMECTDACPDGFTKAGCEEQSAGTCIKGPQRFALVAEKDSMKIRKIDMVTANVTTLKTTIPCKYSFWDVDISCDGTVAIYVCDNQVVEFNLITGESSVIAGQTAGGYINDKGILAEFAAPNGVQFSKDCTYVLVADTYNRVIRKIDLSTKMVSTFAGSGTGSFVDGPALKSSFHFLSQIAFHPSQTYFLVTDTGRIRKITLKPPMTTSTPLHTGIPYIDICIPSDGLSAFIVSNQNILKLNLANNKVTTLLTFAASILPYAISLYDHDQYFTVTCSQKKVLRVSSTSGIWTVLAGSGTSGNADGVGIQATFKDPLTISAWSGCPAGYYALENKKCMACLVCTAGTSYESVPCTHTSNRECSVCDACVLGSTYQVSACNVKVNRQCAACGTCEFGSTYELSSCTLTSNLRCAPLYVNYSLGSYTYLCVACATGKYNGACNVLSVGTCFSCAACPVGYSRSNCTGQSSGTCVVGQGNFALIADQDNDMIRKIELATANVTSMNPECSFAGYFRSIVVSCDGQFAVYPCLSTLRVLNLTTGTSRVLAGDLDQLGTEDGIGTAARFGYAIASLEMSRDCTYVMVTDAAGYTLRKVFLNDGRVLTVAGDGTPGYADGLALSSQFFEPIGIAFVPNGSFALVIDSCRIRKVTLDGIMMITSVAGGLSKGQQNGFGLNATFWSTADIDISPDGAFALVTDVAFNSIRKIDMQTYEVTTLVPSSSVMSNIWGISMFQYEQYALVTTISFANSAVWRISTVTGEVTFLAGNGLTGYSDGVGINAEFGIPYAVAVWSRCPDGYYRTGNTQCIACKAGYIMNSSLLCQQCGIYTFSPGVGSSMCTPCLAGTHMPLANAIFTPRLGSVVCEWQCNIGYVKDPNGLMMCNSKEIVGQSQTPTPLFTSSTSTAWEITTIASTSSKGSTTALSLGLTSTTPRAIMTTTSSALTATTPGAIMTASSGLTATTPGAIMTASSGLTATTPGAIMTASSALTGTTSGAIMIASSGLASTTPGAVMTVSSASTSTAPRAITSTRSGLASTTPVAVMTVGSASTLTGLGPRTTTTFPKITTGMPTTRKVSMTSTAMPYASSMTAAATATSLANKSPVVFFQITVLEPNGIQVNFTKYRQIIAILLGLPVDTITVSLSSIGVRRRHLMAIDEISDANSVVWKRLLNMTADDNHGVIPLTPQRRLMSTGSQDVVLLVTIRVSGWNQATTVMTESSTDAFQARLSSACQAQALPSVVVQTSTVGYANVSPDPTTTTSGVNVSPDPITTTSVVNVLPPPSESGGRRLRPVLSLWVQCGCSLLTLWAQCRCSVLSLSLGAMWMFCSLLGYKIDALCFTVGETYWFT